MRVFFRTDASVRIGTGHVMRCLTLADALRARGAEVAFVCGDLEGNLLGYIRQSGFSAYALPRPAAAAAAERDAPAHAHWSESSWSDDAEGTAAAIQKAGGAADWLVVDHYALDARWEERMRPHAARLFCIDDLADRGHACDLILDQNLFDGPSDRYARLLPEACRRLLGPGFAILRPEFASIRSGLRPRDGQVRRVLVSFGGADLGNAASLAVEALSLPEFSGLEVEVVAGALNPHRQALEAVCARRAGTTVYHHVKNMAELMARADLAIGAGGTTTWERCCLGLPTLTASVADNQREVTACLARHGAILDLGWGGDLSADGIASALRAAIGAQDPLAAMSRLGMDMVDGLGAERVAESIFSPPANGLRIRSARPWDMLTYFHWANEAEARKQSYRSDAIPLAEHSRWFAARLADPGTRLWVAEASGDPAGQIRFQRDGDTVWISFSVDARFRGRGIGGFLLREGVRLLKEESPWPTLRIRGAVKKSNLASRKAFLRSGYIESETSLHGEASFIFTHPG